jgi:hypothetical protein
MANKSAFQARFREAMREAVRKFLAEEELPEPAAGEALFTVIEDLALDAGDAVSLEVFDQRLAQLPLEPATCPHCGADGQRVRQRDRTLTTRRGLDVPLAEQQCYCPGCRRAFFPSLHSAGTGCRLSLQPRGDEEGRPLRRPRE